MIGSVIFAVVALVAFGYAGYQFSKIRRNILLGKDADIEPGRAGERWKNVLLIAFGQKKMFKRWIPAVFHLFIYVAFLFTQIELIEIIIDGLFSQHRFFADKLGGFYGFLISFIEVLSVLAFVATLIFLIRRNALKIPRLRKPELKGWPKLDANLILIFEIILLIGIFSMNGADMVLQERGAAGYPDTGNLAFSQFLGPMLFDGLSNGQLVIVERFGWWLHLIMVFVFLNYLPISKHLHILMAFPNTYYARLEPKGEMDNMPDVMNEVKSMMDPEAAFDESAMEEELPTFGANDIFDLSWKHLLGAYTCTECGRCTAVCPANITGKKLSPRKIVMNVRDRMEEVGKKLDSGNPEFIAEDKRGEGVVLAKENFDDGRSLFDYITREELHACTTCNACVEACPVQINPLEPILAMRRYEILTESAGPSDWVPMFTAIENTGTVWSVNDDREAWTRG